VAVETPLQQAKNLSMLTGNRVLLKREDLQPVFSFKIRGAYNKIAHLATSQDSAQLKSAGIITCSAGNHAQGVALSASKLGIQNLIVMPEITPLIKVRAVQRLGGNVQLVGKNFDEAATAAKSIAHQQGSTLIHPYDDPYVIAGQGTIALEILKQCASKFWLCFGSWGLTVGLLSCNST
jgi:threonine dehydratase